MRNLPAQTRGVGLVGLANIFYGMSIVAGVAGVTGIWTWIFFTALGQAIIVLGWLGLRRGREVLSPGVSAVRIIRIGALIAAQVGLYLAALAITDDGAIVVALHLCAPLVYLTVTLVMRRRPATWRDLAVAALVVSGITLATGAAFNIDAIAAMALSLLSAVMIALMWWEMSRLPYGVNRTATMGWAVLVVAALFAWAPLVDGSQGMGIPGWGWALLVGIALVTPAGFLEWFGVAQAGPMLTSLAALIQLPATAALLWLVRGDPLGPAQVIATAAIALAVALELTRRRETATDRAEDVDRDASIDPDTARATT